MHRANVPPRSSAGRSRTAAHRAEEASAGARDAACGSSSTNESWVEVYDSRGERLFYDVASAGSVQSVEGRGRRCAWCWATPPG